MTKVNGLQFVASYLAYSSPNDKVPEFKAGINYETSSTKGKFLTNLRTLVGEGSLTYLARDNLVLGTNFVLDPRA